MRKEKTITLEDRGKKLTFRIQEMPATQLMEWSERLIGLLAAAGADVPTGAGIDTAFKYFADNGFKVLGSLDYEKVKPLKETLFSCCYRQVGNAEERVTLATADAYIEDVSTLWRLLIEAFSVHFDFFRKDAQSVTPEQVSIDMRKRGSKA